MAKSKSAQIENETPLTRESIDSSKKHISNYELFSYVLGMGFYAMFTGMINTYRTDYINNIIQLSEKNQQIMSAITTIAGFVIGFFIMSFIDNFHSKRGKFRPIVLASTIPMALTGFLLFYTPFEDANSRYAMIYVVSISALYTILFTLTEMGNTTAIVMTPNEEERNSLLSFTNFFSSIMNSAPLVIILVLGFFLIKTDEQGNKVSGYFDKNTMYIIAMALCATLYAVTTINAMLKVKERVPYMEKKESPFIGMGDVVKNKNFWFLTLSNSIRDIRKVGTGFGIFVAGALLGGTDKFLLIGLPTGIGTVVSMLIVQKMIKKIDVIKVNAIFSVYSLFANALAFVIAVIYFKYGGLVWQVLFVLSLFLIGLQFGSANIIPNIFKGDVLNEIELQTGGKRLEQTVNFSSSIVSTLIGVVTGILTPTILLNVCGYQQGSDIQTETTKIKLVFFYTLFAGIFFCLSLLPMIGYKLNKKRREEISAQIEVMRAERIGAEDVEEETYGEQWDISSIPPEIVGDPIEKGFEETGENIAREFEEESREKNNNKKYE
ncbi:MAG: MFS transporter [Clostridia bacterium]|nr:MFS transporter [Clostridia bacterium]